MGEGDGGGVVGDGDHGFEGLAQREGAIGAEGEVADGAEVLAGLGVGDGEGGIEVEIARAAPALGFVEDGELEGAGGVEDEIRVDGGAAPVGKANDDDAEVVDFGAEFDFDGGAKGGVLEGGRLLQGGGDGVRARIGTGGGTRWWSGAVTGRKGGGGSESEEDEAGDQGENGATEGESPCGGVGVGGDAGQRGAVAAHGVAAPIRRSGHGVCMNGIVREAG